jgi:pimeloyl-ACP methyl ester carboxylesterase
LRAGPAAARLFGMTSVAHRRVVLAAAAVAVALVAAAPAAARSGTVTVPLDRADAAAGTTRVAYRLIPRRDRSSPAQATILFNPGGPGQAPIGLAAVVRRELAPLLEHRDLLLIDPRGTGRSDALHCRGDGDAGLAFAAHDAFIRAIGDCGRRLGSRARMYGSAAVADDFEAVRAALGIETLDLWGESYGTYLMTVFASRHPEHVRSIVLSGAYPIDFDPWGRDRLAASRRAIRLICARTHSCRGAAVLDDLAHVAARLRRRPVRFTVGLGERRYPVVLDEGALAELVYAQGDPRLLGRVPRAAAAARTGDLGPLRRLLTEQRRARAALIADPAAAALFSVAQGFATMCHDYPRAFSYDDPLPARRAAYDRALGALDPRPFRPFSPRGWSRAGFEGTDTCLGWPPDPTAGAPLAGDAPLPGVPVLVLSGDLDTNTPPLAGRQAARQFAHATWAQVANAGHTPTGSACAVRLATRFVTTLTARPKACATPRGSTGAGSR